MDKNKIAIVIATLALVLALGVAIFKGGTETRTIVEKERTLAGVSNLDSLTLGDDLVVDKTSTLTGSTTPTQLLFPIGGTISTAATGTARTVNANTTGPKLCFAGSAALSLRNTGTFSPSLVFSVGTSTSAVATRNLIASSTVATSTPGTSTFNTVSAIADSEFIYANGDELMAIIGDITNTEASTTHMTNLTADFRILCSEIAI